jgi:hypothetical protein
MARLDLIDNPEEYDPSFQFTVLTPQQRYNLHNQSWGLPRKNKAGVLSDPLELYEDALSLYPSNSEVVWTGLQFQPVEGGADPYERLYPNLFQDKLGVDAKAPKGYFIIDLLRRGQSRVDAYNANSSKHAALLAPSLTTRVDSTSGGARYVCSFAGRVFYAGFNGEITDGDVRSPNLSNFVAFSQLIKSKKDFTKCYQEGDPTSRENSDIVDTDGGFIKVSGAEKIIGIVPLGPSVIVIASNGIWAITGGSDYGFTATNYRVDKLSSYGGIGPNSIVEDGDKIFFWGEDGIYVVSRTEAGTLNVTNITEQSIQTYFQSIPNESKLECVGTYDILNKTVRWIFNNGEERFSTSYELYELVLNTVIGAFYKNRINTAGSQIDVVSCFSSTQFSSLSSEDSVVSETEPVIVGAVPVVSDLITSVGNVQSTRYLVFKKLGDILTYSFAFYRNTNYEDWPEIEGQDAKAFLITGTITAGDSGVAKQAPYLILHMERTEQNVDAELEPLNQSGIKIRSQWDFANKISSNKWSPLFQGYRYRKERIVTDPSDDYDTGFEVVTTKNKLRGRGRALAIYMESEPGKNCKILGWNLLINGNEQP